MSAGETVIVISPWAFGSGKFGTPWERMQAVYLTPAAPVPTCVDILAPNPPTPGGNTLELLLGLPLLEGVVPRLATDGGYAPSPQPAASSATPARTTGSRATLFFELTGRSSCCKADPPVSAWCKSLPRS